MKKIIKLFLIVTLAFTISFNYVKAESEDENSGQEVETLITSAPVVSVKGNNNTLTLSWEAVENATSYVVERSTNAKKGFKKVGTVTITSFTNKKLTYGTTYYYKVIARGPQNKKTSTVVSKKVKPNKVVINNLKPGSTQVKVTWGKTSNSGYYVYRSTDGKKWTKVKTINKSSTTSYTDKKLKSNKKYYYQVQAFQKVGRKTVNGSRSAVMEVRTAPAAPKLVLKSAYVDELIFTLYSVSGAVKYQVYHAPNKKANYEYLGELSPEDFTNGRFRTWVGVEKPYVQEYYRVRACSDVSCGSFTTAHAQGQLEKTTIEVLKGEKKAVTIGWTWVYSADGYEIYRATSKNGKYKKIKTVSAKSALTYKDKGVSTNRTYYYKIRSYITIGKKKYYSAYSAVRKVKTGKDAAINSAMEDAKVISKLYYPSKSAIIEGLVEEYGYKYNDAKKGVEKAKINFKENALKSAKDFVNWEIPSEEALKNELLSAGFTEAEANYAVSKVVVDWHQKLKESIENELRWGTSRKELIEMYTSEEVGYTEEQVLSVIEELNPDFNEQALMVLQKYVSNYDYTVSSDRATNYLTEQEFTESEIEYAIENADIDWIANGVNAYRTLEEEYYSRAEVEEILTDEYYQFTLEDLDLVFTRISVNFNEVALQKANNLVGFNDYSENELRAELTRLKFTEENVNYAIENGEFNFDEMALNSAILIMELNDYDITRVSMRGTLEGRNFTNDNITYAINNIPELSWRRAAIVNATNYVSYVNRTQNRGLSRTRSVETLSSLEFTEEEINIAKNSIDQEDHDFFGKQARISAIYQLDNYILSESELKSVLVNSELFLEQEVQYAINIGMFDFNGECVQRVEETYIGQEPTKTLTEVRNELKNTYGFEDVNIDYAFENTNINDYVISE